MPSISEKNTLCTCLYHFILCVMVNGVYNNTDTWHIFVYFGTSKQDIVGLLSCSCLVFCIAAIKTMDALNIYRCFTRFVSISKAHIFLYLEICNSVLLQFKLWMSWIFISVLHALLVSQRHISFCTLKSQSSCCFCYHLYTFFYYMPKRFPLHGLEVFLFHNGRTKSRIATFSWSAVE